ncbi:porin [Skermanella mucosa]|uniref:porin n=1 Tax=Skermanella mucosa TaxID=1789672 RepID=UPI00192B127D|nr:porin [Skermanella mucosa]UEM22208.1 porin [Skermanella mucosa]
MRNLLLATTAIAAVALSAQSAQAQLVVSLGGYTEFFGAYYDDDASNRTSREFALETEIVVRADGKADNGLLYGAKVELQNSTGAASNSVGTDEASVYLGGTWGRIELGDFDGAADTLAIYAPLIGVEQIDGDGYRFLENSPDVGPRAGFALGSLPTGSVVQAPDSGDATKVMYLTPRFGGVQAGVSYATQDDSEGQDVVGFKTAGGYKDFWEVGANYTGEFSGFSVAAGATGSTATGQDLGVVGGPSLEDFWAWQVGGQVGYGAFKLGGGYIDGGDYNAVSGVPATSGDTTIWHVGVSYTAGPLAVGLSYADAEGFKGGPEFDDFGGVTPATYASSYKTYGGGAAYTLAPGFTVQGDVMYVDEDLRNVDATTGVASTTSNEGIVAILSTRLDF